MPTTSPSYGTPAGLTITLTSLAIDAWRASASIDNGTSVLYMDGHLGGSIQVGAVGATAGQYIGLYLYGSWDGTDYTSGLDGTNTTITWGTTPSTSSILGYENLFYLASISVDPTDDNNDIEFGPYSIASVFGGWMPTKWGVVVQNKTDIALNATGTNNVIEYMPLNYASA